MFLDPKTRDSNQDDQTRGNGAEGSTPQPDEPEFDHFQEIGADDLIQFEGGHGGQGLTHRVKKPQRKKRH